MAVFANCTSTTANNQYTTYHLLRVYLSYSIPNQSPWHCSSLKPSAHPTWDKNTCEINVLVALFYFTSVVCTHRNKINKYLFLLKFLKSSIFIRQSSCSQSSPTNLSCDCCYSLSPSTHCYVTGNYHMPRPFFTYFILFQTCGRLCCKNNLFYFISC